MSDAGQSLWGQTGTARPRARFAKAATILRLRLTYLWRHHRWLSLDDPMRFTELVQRRKLIDHDQRLPRLIDKVAVKRFVAASLGREWVTPTLWSGNVLPLTPPWPVPFVVKSRHGCNQRRFVRDGSADWGAIRRAAARWMQRDYGRWLDEWGYRGIPRGLLVEPFVGDRASLPIDYKFYVFHGRVEAVQVHLDREHHHRWIVLDRDWRRLSAATADPDPIAPATLARMIGGAETLARDFDFARVDLYETGGKPRFGEITFYPGSGLDRFDPPALDTLLGGFWLAGASIARPAIAANARDWAGAAARSR